MISNPKMTDVRMVFIDFDLSVPARHPKASVVFKDFFYRAGKRYPAHVGYAGQQMDYANRYPDMDFLWVCKPRGEYIVWFRYNRVARQWSIGQPPARFALRNYT